MTTASVHASEGAMLAVDPAARRALDAWVDAARDEPDCAARRDAAAAVQQARAPDGCLVVSGDWIVLGGGLTALPDPLTVTGCLALHELRKLDRLPQRLEAEELVIDSCEVLAHWPTESVKLTNLTITGSPRLREWPPGLRVTGSLTLRDSALLELPSKLELHGSLAISGESNLQHLPNALRIVDSLRLRDLAQQTSFPRWPASLQVGRNVELENVPSHMVPFTAEMLHAPKENGTFLHKIHVKGTSLPAPQLAWVEQSLPQVLGRTLVVEVDANATPPVMDRFWSWSAASHFWAHQAGESLAGARLPDLAHSARLLDLVSEFRWQAAMLVVETRLLLATRIWQLVQALGALSPAMQQHVQDAMGDRLGAASLASLTELSFAIAAAMAGPDTRRVAALAQTATVVADLHNELTRRSSKLTDDISLALAYEIELGKMASAGRGPDHAAVALPISFPGHIAGASSLPWFAKDEVAKDQLLRKVLKARRNPIRSALATTSRRLLRRGSQSYSWPWWPTVHTWEANVTRTPSVVPNLADEDVEAYWEDWVAAAEDPEDHAQRKSAADLVRKRCRIADASDWATELIHSTLVGPKWYRLMMLGIRNLRSSVPSDLDEHIGDNLSPLQLDNLHDSSAGRKVMVVAGDWCLSSFGRITALPSDLCVAGVLDLRYCSKLTVLPPGLAVAGDLLLQYCVGLESLGDVRAAGITGGSCCSSIYGTGSTSRARACAVGREARLNDVMLRFANAIDFCARAVTGTLWAECETACFGDTLTTGNGLYLATSIASPFDRLLVAGTFHAGDLGKSAQDGIAEHVQAGSLKICAADSLELVATNLSANSVTILTCLKLLEVAKTIQVGSLRISECVSLVRLAGSGQVQNLTLLSLRSLERLSPDVEVSGDLVIEQCVKLAEIPQSYFAPPSKKGKALVRNVTLDETAISKEELDRLMDSAPEGIRMFVNLRYGTALYASRDE